MYLEKTLNNPLIHTFRTSEHYYLYDSPSNEIIKTDSLTYRLFKKETKVDGISHEEYSRRVKLLEQLSNGGIFSISKFDGMGFQLEKDFIECSLKENIQEIVLNVTEDCNFRCRYCAYSGLYKYERKHSKKRMSNEIGKKVIDWFDLTSKKSPIIYLGFYGGEPLLNFDLIKDLVLYNKKKFKNKKRFFAITTNGSLINREKFDFFILNNVILTVSLDGPQEIHDKNRINIINKPTFEEIYNNLIELKRYNEDYYNKNINFSITLSPSNNLLEIVNFFSTDELVKDHIYFINNINRFDTRFFDFYPAREKEVKRFYEDLQLLKERYIESIINGNEDKFLASFFRKKLRLINNRPIGLTKIIKPNGLCIPGLRRVFVDNYGRFCPCEKVGGNFSIGNIKRGLDYNKIFELVNNYIQISKEDCLTCWASRFCNMCLSNSKKGEEISIERKREQCGRIKKEIDNTLRMYCSISEKNPTALNDLTGLEPFED